MAFTAPNFATLAITQYIFVKSSLVPLLYMFSSTVGKLKFLYALTSKIYVNSRQQHTT